MPWMLHHVLFIVVTLHTGSNHTAALMKKFRDLSSLLNKPPANNQEANSRVNVEAEEAQYRCLVKDWNRTVEEIRKIKGFSCFLLPPLFSDLQDAARDGPIIMLIASRANGESLSQKYISSYTPSLTTLMKARRSHDKSLSVSFAVIGQNHPASALFTLDSVEPELDLVLSLLPPPPTVSSTKKFDKPFKSAFLMHDHPLSLLDITQMDLSQHQFAFLSACETAVGAFSTPNEVIHLAAGLQFAGVKSVIGTLWKVNNSTVQRLVEAFYKNLCGNSKMNSKRAALALHQAVHSLARDKDMPLDQRIVFIHIGI
ncbi:CHAT domain-containing protein [Suillus subluteus]|nr:CHAT domain-containing protein [Suillus subluteus]